MNKRRGLSSVIGMVFLVIVLSSTIGYFTYGVNLIENLNDQIIIKTTELQEKSRENFEITNARIDQGKFNLTVHNTGDLPINVTRMWINNVTDNTWPLQNYTINKIATPKTTLTNIGQELNLQALESQAYSIKLVTQRGTAKDFSLNSPNQEMLDLRLVALPETVPDGFRTTLLLTVTNNMTSDNMLLNIKPIMQTPQATGDATYTLISDITPSKKPILERGDSAYFTWVYEISGALDETVMFTVNLQNGIPQNTASAIVKINDVLLAQQSETALISSTLATPPKENILNFHAETENTPQGEWQMFPGDTDTGGTTISVETEHPDFFSNYGNAINIQSGKWNASLTYFSAPFADSLMDNNSINMKFHFEGNVDPEDSTGNTNGHVLGPMNKRPTYESAGGPHNSGAFRFDGGDYIEIDEESENNVGNAPDTTALWFKADDGTSTNQILYGAYENPGNEYYEIGIDTDDDVYFTFRGGSGTPTICESSGFDYENDKWQHVVAVRPGSYQCILYINGSSVDVNSIGSGGSNVEIDEIFIGAEDTNPGNGFNGVIDDVIHWDNYDLSSSEVTDLFNTNYGDLAHQVTFFLNKTNSAGIPQTNIATDINYPLKFLDGKENSEFLDSFNYTTTVLGWSNFTSTERLVLDMEFESGLDMDLRIDDTSLISNPASSFLQHPPSKETFSSYITVVADQTKTLTVYNGGPSTAWITFEGTRLTFDDTDSTNTFAAIILQANGTDVNSNQDSISFPTGSVLDLTFTTAKDPPATSGSVGLITPGNYNMKMHISGYDIDGKSLVRTIDFGIVSVTS